MLLVYSSFGCVDTQERLRGKSVCNQYLSIYQNLSNGLKSV